MLWLRSYFHQSIKKDLKSFDNIRIIVTEQGDDYTTGFLIILFQNHYKLIAINLSKQQKLYADPNAIQQINFRGNLNRVEDSTMFLIIKEAKETGLHFSRGAIKVLGFLFRFNVI